MLIGREKRRQHLKEILEIERAQLGPDATEETPFLLLPKHERKIRSASQAAYAQRLATPLNPPARRFTNFLPAPRSLRGAGSRSNDVLFEPSPDDSTFWIYGSQKVAQSTIGNIPPNFAPDDVRKLPICNVVKKKLDQLMVIAKSKARCGLVFDILSTNRIISNGIPHGIGALVYEYLEQAHADVRSLKFIFVGITDNANCCAARDVFCRDDVLNGKYIGDKKRPFDALDNIHMYCVFPGHRIHPLTRGAPPASESQLDQSYDARDATFITQDAT